MKSTTPTPSATIRRVVTLQADSRERLRRVRWYQAYTPEGEAYGSPQPTARLVRACYPALFPPVPFVPRTLSRPPNESEIRFGHGCRIHYTGTVDLPKNRRYVVIDGVRWTVAR